MDSPPVIFKRKGAASKPAQRAREISQDSDVDSESNVPETATESLSTLAIRLKKKNQKSKPKSRLSFGGDEEGAGEVFQVKKSKLSQKVSLGTHPAVVAPVLEHTRTSTDGPKYDAAYLKELKANTPSSRPRFSNEDLYDADMLVDIGEASIVGIDMEVEEISTHIPSESTVKVAKEKRDRLRKAHIMGEEDFISLSVTRREDVPQGPHPESRLMREEDELGEGEDEYAEYTSAQERIALGKKSRKLETSKRRNEMKELIDDAEDDEETAEWMEEQLRRGGPQITEPSSKAKVKPVYRAAPIPPATPVPSLAPAISRLSGQLELLTTSHAKNSATLSSLAHERLEVDEREKELREMVEKAEEKRAWFSSFREWIEGVAGFLDEKYPMLEKLEKEHISLLRERADMITKRRRKDDEDDLSTFLGPLPSPRSTEIDELDELGRTVPQPDPAKEQRDRRVARAERRQRRSSRRSRTAGEEEDGYSTDSSLAPADFDAYITALQSLTSHKKEVLADVRAEEFRDPGKGKWRIWREKYPDSYVGAWGGLGVVSIWEFWMRLESVGWDCIEDNRSLHSFKWYKGLYEYSRPGKEGSTVEERELGPDGDLVASMISTAVIPIICKILEGGALDVYSLEHTRRVIDLCEEIEASLEEGNIKFQILLKSVVDVFQIAIHDTETCLAKFKGSHDVLPGFNPDSIPARVRFLIRRVKLLKNLLLWRKYKDRYGIDVLVGRLVDVCIIEVAQGGWTVGGQDVVRQISKLLPSELIPLSLKTLL